MRVSDQHARRWCDSNDSALNATSADLLDSRASERAKDAEIERLRARVAELEARPLDVEALGRALTDFDIRGHYISSGGHAVAWEVAKRYAEEVKR